MIYIFIYRKDLEDSAGDGSSRSDLPVVSAELPIKEKYIFIKTTQELENSINCTF